MDHHNPDAHQMKQDDVGDDRSSQFLRDHGVAAVFHHNGLAVVLLDVGQGFGQHRRPVDLGVVHIMISPFLSAKKRKVLSKMRLGRL
ncbi:hypothetical protein SDC9_102592 [bioreactor metagenome]|uniref:Uncharacterized protein n=1 Tax=bioreactor metagenome TaxID=1076179 RepID=A0A645ARA0_9ZZZZ